MAFQHARDVSPQKRKANHRRLESIGFPYQSGRRLYRMSRVQMIRSGLSSYLAEHIARTVEAQDDFLPLVTLGDLRATGQQKRDLRCGTSLGEYGGMALELHFLSIGYDGSAIGSRNLRKSFEALYRIDSPFEVTVGPGHRRPFLDDGKMSDYSIRGREDCSHDCRLTHVFTPPVNSQGIRCSLSCATPTCLQ